MRLTSKLLGSLNRVFDKDAKKFLALRFNYAGTMSWKVEDLVLTTRNVDGDDLSIDLTQHTLSSLAAYLAAQDGYTVTYIDASRAHLSARVLINDANTPSASNGDHLYGFSSLLWAFLDAYAVELAKYETAVELAPLQMSTTTAEDFWLDEIGDYFKVPRIAGEPDAVYGPRIIAETVRPKGNNVAMELAIKAYTGQDVTVTDVVDTIGGVNFYDGSVNHDGSIDYDTSVSTRYCLFDVEYGYDVLNGGAFDDFADAVRDVVGRLRAAGTHLRNLTLTSPEIGDAYSDPITDALDAFMGAMTIADSVSAPVEAFEAMAGIFSLSEDVNPPTEDSELNLVYGYLYDGSRTYDGSFPHAGGTTPVGTIEG